MRHALLVAVLVALGAAAFGAGGCMVDAAVDTEVNAMPLSFPQGGLYSGQYVSQSRTVPVSLNAPVLHQLSAVHIKTVVLRPLTGVNTLDFFRGISLIAHDDTHPDLTLTSVGPDLLQPADDGSLTLPVDITLPTDFIDSGLSIEATIDFIVPGLDWSVSDTFELTLLGQRTIT